MYLRCHAGIAVPTGLYASLAADREALPRPPRSIVCELQSAHHGDHFGFLRGTGARQHVAWWLLWDDTAGIRSLLQRAYCRGGGPVGLCLLPEDHEGCHQRQLAAPLDVPANVRLLLPASTPAR